MARDRRLAGHKFKRQYLVANYIVDFVCLEKMLIVEVDGGEHEKTIAYDKERDAHLDGLGYRVMRFWNDDVAADIESVLRIISMALA